MVNNNNLLLNYHDACIYDSDIKLLECHTEWLNDACINYQLKCLEEKTKRSRHVDNDNAGANSSPCMDISNIEFIDPSIVSFFMHQLSIECEDDHDELISLCRSWNLVSQTDTDIETETGKRTDTISSSNDNSKSGNDSHSGSRSFRMLVTPINDNNSASSFSFQNIGGGNHWSLLIVISLSLAAEEGPSGSANSYDSSCSSNSRDHLLYFHFDSSSSYNKSTATVVANKINQMHLLHHGTSTRTCTDKKDDQDNANSMMSNDNIGGKVKKVKNSVKVIECNVPQQQNGYDCGVHTLATADVISSMKHLLVGENDDVTTKGNSNHKDDILRVMEEIKFQFEKNVEDYMCGYRSVCDMAKCLRTSIANDIRNRIV
jgi:hypothetical protein